jgi:hypothetical protein
MKQVADLADDDVIRITNFYEVLQSRIIFSVETEALNNLKGNIPVRCWEWR